MKPECSVKQFEFHGLGHRDIIGKNDGGLISSDGGGLLLREVEKRTGLLKGLSACFTDYRNPVLIEHTVEPLINQRVMSIALGYRVGSTSVITIGQLRYLL